MDTTNREALSNEVEDLRNVPGEHREAIFRQLLEDRGVKRACMACGGYGTRMYSTTATWRGGIGGAAITRDVCDKCWGSGDSDKPLPDWRQIEQLRREVAVKDEALRVALGNWNRASCNGEDEETERAMHISLFERALSSTPSGMRVVSKPELMLLLDTIQELRDVQNGCPLPDYQEMFDAANEQAAEMLQWLSWLIGGSDE